MYVCDGRKIQVIVGSDNAHSARFCNNSESFERALTHDSLISKSKMIRFFFRNFTAAGFRGAVFSLEFVWAKKGEGDFVIEIRWVFVLNWTCINSNVLA